MSLATRRLSRITRTITPSFATPVGGPAGIAWSSPIFEDNFTGTQLDTTKWASSWFNGSVQNQVTTSPANVSVSGSNLILTLSSSTSGASINTSPDDAATSPFTFTTGYAEARIFFPGNNTSIYNWPAWWINGRVWPNHGENDIAEGLGTMTVNYHSASGGHNQGTVPGIWSNAFHTYAIHRKVGSCDVYYDGILVKSYTTDDGEAPQYLILTLGYSADHPTVFGSDSQVRVDYVRVWST